MNIDEAKLANKQSYLQTLKNMKDISIFTIIST